MLQNCMQHFPSSVISFISFLISYSMCSLKATFMLYPAVSSPPISLMGGHPYLPSPRYNARKEKGDRDRKESEVMGPFHLYILLKEQKRSTVSPNLGWRHLSSRSFFFLFKTLQVYMSLISLSLALTCLPWTTVSWGFSNILFYKFLTLTRAN